MREQSEIDTAQIVKDFFLGEFSFDELKYDPENLPKGNRKELAGKSKVISFILHQFRKMFYLL